MAKIKTWSVHSLMVDDLELELIHNLLSAGPRLGHSTFRKVAYDLLGDIEEVRGELEVEDRLFDFADPEADAGLEWHREEPYESA